MSTFLQFLQVLISLGPQFATVWRLVMAIVTELNAHQPRGCVYAQLSPTEQGCVDQLHKLAATHGGLSAAAFSIQDLLKVWQIVQAHPELKTAIQAIIAAFRKFHPTPEPSPETAPPAAI